MSARRSLELCLVLCAILSGVARAATVAPTLPSSPPTVLTLQHAVQRALQRNLAVLLARAGSDEARGRAIQARAELLPHLSATASQANQTINLVALGFRPGTFPGLRSTLIGPFNTFDARLQLAQSLFNLAAVLRTQAGRAAMELSRLQEQLARNQVATAVELSYLGAQRSQRAVEDAAANLALARSLLTQAEDQRAAGVATGLDVTRAATRVAQNEARLAQSRTAAEQDLLELRHAVGLPLDGALVLADPLGYTATAAPAVASVLPQALQARPEIQVAQQEVRVDVLAVALARAGSLPTVDVAAGYGLSGNTPTQNDELTHSVLLRVSVPISSGGLTRGRVLEAQGRQHAAEARLQDVGVQVEQDVRNAVSALQTATAEVAAARRAVELAGRELKMARDRFKAGLGDNVEVVTAQTAVADARDAEATALTRYNAARINLAAAVGQPETFRW